MRRDYAEFGVEMNKVEALPRMDTASECAESALDASVVKQPKRVMGAFSATMIVVASMVGTGVFTTTGILLETTPSAPAVLWGCPFDKTLAACVTRNAGEPQIIYSQVFQIAKAPVVPGVQAPFSP